MQIGDKVEVRLWHTDVPAGTPDGMEGNYRTWVGPWLPGTVRDIGRRGQPWVQFVGEHGDLDYRYFNPSDVRPA